jgi:hypothetical protein
MRKGGSQDIPDGFTFLHGRVLIEIAGGDAVAPFHLSGIGMEVPCDDVQKSGLAFAIRANQADMLSLEQAEGYIIEYGSSPKPVNDILNGKNAQSNPPGC